jgi:hypothetical protein
MHKHPARTRWDKTTLARHHVTDWRDERTQSLGLLPDAASSCVSLGGQYCFAAGCHRERATPRSRALQKAEAAALWPPLSMASA